jgi:hypothetical protein
MTCCLPDRAVSLSVWWSLPDDNDAETGGRYRPPVFIWPNGFSSRAADAMRSHDVAKLHGPLRTCLARAGRPDHSSFLAGDGWTDRWFRRCITRSGTVGAVRLERLGCVGGIGFCLAVCSPVAAPIGGGAIAEPVPVCRCRSWFEWRASCRTGHDHSPGGCPIPEPAGRAHQVGAGESNLRAIEPQSAFGKAMPCAINCHRTGAIPHACTDRDRGKRQALESIHPAVPIFPLVPEFGQRDRVLLPVH